MKKYKIKESETTELYEQLAQEYGGNWDGEHLTINQEDVELNTTFYQDIFGVSLGINEVKFKEDTVIVIQQDTEPFLMLRFILDSEFNIPNRDNVFIGPNYENGVFLSNTHTPIEINLPKGELIRWIAVRLKVDDWNKINKGDRFPKLDALFHDKQPWLIAKPINQSMEKCLREIIAYQNKEYGHKVLSIAKALELSSLLFTQLIKEGEQGEELGMMQDDYEVIINIKNLLEKDFVSPPKIDDISKQFGQSSTKIRQNFKKVTGLPIHQFVMKERYAAAYKRLLNTEDSITEIALDLGFSNSAHFSDGFKKYYSLSPSQVRQDLPR